MNARQKASCLLRKSGNVLYQIASWVYKSPRKKTVALWFADNGDETLRLNYELDGNSLVLDLGGYKGQWTSDIYGMYCCWIHIFEPVEEFARKIEKRFSKNPKISVHQFGLADKNQVAKIGLDQTGSSVFKPGKRLVEAKLVRAADFDMFSNYETSLDALAFTKHLVYLITGYAGDYVASGKPLYGCRGPSSQELRGEYFALPIHARANHKPENEHLLIRRITRNIRKVLQWRH